jgi:protein-serine/threonine kinase
MILAIESCHIFGFIHRDIKLDVSPFLTTPERAEFVAFVQNFLFDPNGHIKLSDVGLA